MHDASPMRILMFFMLYALAPSGQAQVDPFTVLEAVASRREQLPPMELVLRYLYSDHVVTNESVVQVSFDGERRAFEYKLGGRHYKGVYDGSQVITYSSGVRQAEVRTLDDQNTILLFDPRSLGLSSFYHWTDSPEICLGYKQPGAEIIGQESISGKDTWHIRAVNNKWPVEFWIGIDDLRVYKRRWLRMETLSFYDMPQLSALPSRVESRRFREGKGEDFTLIEVLEFRLPPFVSPERWTMAGMNLPTNTSIIDIGSAELLGAWDGKAVAAEAAPFPKTPRSKMIIVFATLGFVLIFPLACLIFSRLATKPSRVSNHRTL
jgi:hypothetical protein